MDTKALNALISEIWVLAGAMWTTAGLYPPSKIIPTQINPSSEIVSLQEGIQRFESEVISAFKEGFHHARFGLFIIVAGFIAKYLPILNQL